MGGKDIVVISDSVYICSTYRRLLHSPGGEKSVLGEPECLRTAKLLDQIRAGRYNIG